MRDVVRVVSGVESKVCAQVTGPAGHEGRCGGRLGGADTPLGRRGDDRRVCFCIVGSGQLH